jgi:hypothetical protein
MLFLVPGVVPVTLTLKVHELLTASVPPNRLMMDEPAVAVIVPAPQEPVRPLGVATIRPAGIKSDISTPVSATVAFGFVMVKVTLVVPPSGIVAAPNALVTCVGDSTVIVAVAVPPGPLSVEVTLPVVLTFTPDVVPRMMTLNVHEPLAASVPPDREMVDEASVAVTVPAPQEPVSPLGVATITPAGKLSVKATPLSEAPALGLLMVKVKVVFVWTSIKAAPNALLIVGGATCA